MAKTANLVRLQHAQSEMLNFVLFLCTGNYYRSRYAEEIFNHLAKNKGLRWRAFSRGLASTRSSDNIGPMSQHARQALEKKGIVPNGAMRDPQPCSLIDFAKADLVIALREAEHRPLIERRFPEIAAGINYWHVADIEIASPSVALAMIDNHVRELVSAFKERTHIPQLEQSIVNFHEITRAIHGSRCHRRKFRERRRCAKHM